MNNERTLYDRRVRTTGLGPRGERGKQGPRGMVGCTGPVGADGRGQGGILTGSEILDRMDRGDILIRPFNPERLGPNSYDICIGGELMVYKRLPWESLSTRSKSRKTKSIIMDPRKGFVLRPGKLYLAAIQEYTETLNLVPFLEGRSSYGRLGGFIHATAGKGDIGFRGRWTLELTVVEPLRIFPGDVIGQIFYHTICGQISAQYNSSKYQGSTGVVPSKGLGIDRGV